jgi:hypothetical protein
MISATRPQGRSNEAFSSLGEVVNEVVLSRK